jgi:uncharacterized glyoxalase superfamily protein PhnB
MNEPMSEDQAFFPDVVQGLKAGDFSRLAPMFNPDLTSDGSRCRILEWYDRGLFADQQAALEEALTCACFLGRVGVARYLIERGVDPTAGAGTGLDAFHWAVNRGQYDVVSFFIHRKAAMETRNMHGTTVLGTAVWSAINEPKPDHLRIIEALINAGASLDDVNVPTGNERVDQALEPHINKPSTNPEQKLFSIAPYLVVDDIVQAAEFYRNKLGFHFDRYWGEPPCFVIVHRDNVHLMLKGIGSPGHSRPNHRLSSDSPWDAYIWVKDATALYEEFRSRGVKITREIECADYGCLDFDVEDNSGYILCFGQDIVG